MNGCAEIICCPPDDFAYNAAYYANRAQSFTAECEVGTGDPVTVTIPARTYFSDVSQADADAQALTAATSQATEALVCIE